MKAAAQVPRRSFGTAFVIWFVHFMLCWTVAEFQPDGVSAVGLAWLFTALALVAIGLHAWGLRCLARQGEDDRATLRLARGADAIAAVAVVFTAVPAIVWRG